MPSPSPTSTPTPKESPSPTQIPNPTESPTPTPMPTLEPTPTPTPTSVPTLKPRPTGTPKAPPTPTAEPSPWPAPLETSVKATMDNGATVDLPISGNITSSQMSNVEISTKQASATTVSFTLTGKSGTTGFGNVTIPKSLVPHGATLTINKEGQPVQDQGYTQDSQNYYVYYATHFSTHRLSIVFTAVSSSPSSEVQSNLTPAAIYGTATAVTILVIISVIGVLKKERKAQQ